MKLTPNIITEYKEWKWIDETEGRAGFSRSSKVFIQLKHSGKVEVCFKITHRGSHYDSRDNGKKTTQRYVEQELQRMLGTTEGIITYQQAIKALHRAF